MTRERGGSFYDAPGVANAYLRHRHGPVTSPNVVMEEPAFLDELGEVHGLDIVDLGCGDGSFAAASVGAGCASFLGVDGSVQMVDRARASVQAPEVGFVVADIEDLRLPPNSTDVVVSRMVLHYVDELAPVIEQCRFALRVDGRLIFSVVHPVVTASIAGHEGQRTSQVVDNYFEAGERRRDWFGKPVRWHHRTIEQYVQMVLDAGMRIDSLRECSPVEERFEGNTAEFERRRRVPLFLLISARV